jgi:hypothetical protein
MLFLGLSEGSHTNVFRRANSQLQNEQVHHSHQLKRSEGLARAPHQGFANTNRAAPTDQEAAFRSVALRDDFPARLRRTDCLPKSLRHVRLGLQEKRILLDYSGELAHALIEQLIQDQLFDPVRTAEPLDG